MFFECKCETWGKLRRVKHIPKQSGRCVKIKEKRIPKIRSCIPTFKVGTFKEFQFIRMRFEKPIHVQIKWSLNHSKFSKS